MVRTSGGIRISAGKSAKKGGGAANTGGGSRSTASTSSGKSGSSHLPPIPHCEVPSWQKPITNFFTSDAGSSKEKDKEVVLKENVQSPKEDEPTQNIDSEDIENDKENIDKNITCGDDDEPSKKKKKQEESDKENEACNTVN